MIKALEFTLTVSPCLGCHWCPQNTLASAYKSDKRQFHPFDFEKVLNKLPDDCRVDFSGFSECMLHPQVGDFIILASHRFETVLFTTLMGLNKKKADQLSHAMLDFVRIHLPDTVGLKIPTTAWLNQFQLFLTTKLPFTAMAMTSDVDPEIISAVEGTGVKVEFPTMLSRGGNLGHVPIVERIGPIKCAMSRWFQNVILPSGEVVGDCHDYGMTVPLGNLLTQSYQDIHNAARKWKIAMEKDATGTICSRCEWSTLP